MKIVINSLCSFLMIGCLVGGVAVQSAIAQDVEATVVKKQEEKQEAEEAQEPEEPKGYAFEVIKNLEATDVKSQDSTGTCWCFATASFMESELIRMGKGQHDLSEMFVVHNIYQDKARNFVQRQGKANFGEGALAHDFMNAVKRNGLMPEQVYDGLDDDESRHNHGEMSAVLEGMLDKLVERRTKSDKWDDAFRGVLDVYLGSYPDQFNYEGQTYTPREFADSLGFQTRDYVNLTSFVHHPFYESFVLEIPDNYSNGSFFNVPVDELVATIDNAIENGYTVAWDGDVSERGFSRTKGMAILPKDGSPNFNEPEEETAVTQEMRQKTFEEHSTTDDHLMHLTGIAKDKNGNKYYIVKNSWGKVGDHAGFVYLSEPYVRLKTVAILVHKDALPQTVVAKPAAGDVDVKKSND